MQTTIEAIAVFFAALATGGLMVNWLGLARAMTRIRSASAYTEFHQATNVTFDPYMPIVVVGALVSNLAAAVGQAPHWSFPALAALLAVLGYAAVLAISLSTNVPMNRQVATWSVSSPPAGWSVLRERWVRFHIVRTLVSVPALLGSIITATA